MTTLAGGYLLSDDPRRLDLEAVWSFLSSEAYWARWRTLDDVRAQEVPPRTVFVLPGHRGHGLGRAVVAEMVEGGPGRDFRWMLHTADAHGLYAGFGFAPPDTTYLERRSRGIRARPDQD